MCIYSDLAECILADQTDHLNDVSKLSEMLRTMMGVDILWPPEQQHGITLGIIMLIRARLDQARGYIIADLTQALKEQLTEEQADQVMAFLVNAPLQDLLRQKQIAWMRVAPTLGNALREVWQEVMSVNALDLIPVEH